MNETPTSTMADPVVLPRTPIVAEPEAAFNPAGRLWRKAHSTSPFFANVALTAATSVLMACVNLITGPLCARLLGPTGRGELAAIQNLYWVVATLAMLGMPEATLYFTAKKKNEGGRILASSTVLVLLVSPLFFLLLYPLVPIVLAAQTATVVHTARWILLGIPLWALYMIPVFALRGSHDLVWWNLLRAVPTFGWLMLLLVSWKFTSVSAGTIAGGYLVVLAVALAPTFFLARKRIEGWGGLEAKRWPTMLKYGVPLAAAAVPFTLNLRLDQIIMAALMPAKSLGIYAVAASWSGAVPPILLAIGAVLFPRVAAANSAERSRVLTQGVRISSFIAILLVLGLSLITPIAIPLLFGTAFSESVKVGIVLVFAAGIWGVSMVLEEALRGLGETSTVFWAEAGGLLITAVTLAALLRPMGIMGAGIASILGYSSTAVLLLLGIQRKTHNSLSELLLVRVSDLKRAFESFAALRARDEIYSR